MLIEPEAVFAKSLPIKNGSKNGINNAIVRLFKTKAKRTKPTLPFLILMITGAAIAVGPIAAIKTAAAASKLNTLIIKNKIVAMTIMRGKMIKCWCVTIFLSIVISRNEKKSININK